MAVVAPWYGTTFLQTTLTTPSSCIIEIAIYFPVFGYFIYQWYFSKRDFKKPTQLLTPDQAQAPIPASE